MSDLADVAIRAVGDGCQFAVHVQPRARTSDIVGTYGVAVRVRLAALPVDGKANWALVTLLATALGTPASDIRIVAGHLGRDKTVAVAGVAPEVARARLTAASTR
jgi:uncharacterized protein (TIGR00251 family)